MVKCTKHADICIQHVKIRKNRFLFSESHGVVVSTVDSPHNDPGSIPGSGGAVGIWVYYPCGSATSFGWDVKPRSGLRAHAFKNMRGPKRTWMTKRKSRGPETGRYPAFM